MPLRLTVYFSDGFNKGFMCEDDEDATMRRNELLEVGFEEKDREKHVFYPPHAIIKIVITQK